MTINKRFKKQKLLLTVICTLLVLSAALAKHLWQELNSAPNLPGGQLQIHFLDAGNADSVLITSGSSAMLIDAGENSDGEQVVNYIKQQGVKKLDYVIATHPDADHIGGMDVVVNHMDIGVFIMPIMPQSQTPTTNTYLDLLEALDQKNLGISKPRAGGSFMLGSAKVEILAPVNQTNDANGMSVVCRVVNGNRAYLFMGDAEKASENAILKSGADVSAQLIKLGHHGSKGSSGEDFISAVLPEYAVITCGAGNRYGHPHEEVTAILKKHDVKVFRSDYNGTIVVKDDGESIKIETQR